jgi:V/A-type H+-transporting ATPase subunit I
MLRPERMTPTSIICVKKDVESILTELNAFGEFHIEPTAEENPSLTEYNQSIQKVEETLADTNELIKQIPQEKVSPLAIFRNVTPTKTLVTAENWQNLLETTNQKVLSLKKEVDELNSSLSGVQEKTATLNHVKHMLKQMDSMGVDLAAMEELKLIHVEVASIPVKNFEGLKTALAPFPLVLHRYGLTKETNFICLAMPNKNQAEIDRILKTYHADTFNIPKELPQDIKEALKKVEAQLKENLSKEKELSASLNKVGKENLNNLTLWKETQENILALLNAERKILQAGRLATIKGFVPNKKFPDLKEKINSMPEGKALVLEDQAASVEDPPTKITHNRFVKPFEEITKLYGLPKYNELDPTPLIAISFPIIFGLMFGDVGHGLILLIGGAALGKLIKGNQSIKNVCWIMAACGAAAIFAGLLFGEFFGIQLIPPLWFSPFENVFTFLIFSLAVGIAQITSGIVIEMVNFLFKRKVADALLTSLPKIAFYLGAVYLIVVYKLNLGVWFSGPLLIIIVPIVFLIVGKPIYLSLAARRGKKIHKEAEDEVSQRLFDGGDLVTRLLSNTISYTRILALLMAHWALILVVYTVAGLVGTSSIVGIIISGLVVVFGNIFVLALEGLIVFIHTLRLHFYEWFSKFYAGTGTQFSPFKQKFIYTKVVLGKKQE